MLTLIWFHRENIPVLETLYENLGQGSQRWICSSLISVTTLLPSNSVLNEITQDKVGVFWNNLYGKDCTCFIEGFPFSF